MQSAQVHIRVCFSLSYGLHDVRQARKLDTEVLAPMSRWNSAFHTVEVRARGQTYNERHFSSFQRR